MRFLLITTHYSPVMACKMKIATAFLTLACVVHSYGPHRPKGPHSHYNPSRGRPTKLTQDTELLQDEVHISEDLASWDFQPDTKRMTPEELAFHYFKVHDFDNNTKLDGLEILEAIRHTIHDDGETQKIREIPFSQEDFEYYTVLIDRVLTEDDLDKDGYLSYVEYVIGQNKEEKQAQKP